MSERVDLIKITVKLNGTDNNPYSQWGVTSNPFPQYAKYPYTGAVLHLQKLGSDPIPDVAYIREHLKGWNPEFVDLCCDRFKKGEMVSFEISFEDK